MRGNLAWGAGIAFALLALGASVLRWVCVGLAGPSGFTPFPTMVAGCLMTIALYPVVAGRKPIVDAVGGLDNLKRWTAALAARPGVTKGMTVPA